MDLQLLIWDWFIEDWELVLRGEYLVLLDDIKKKKYLNFDKWWNEIVIIDIDGHKFTRERLVKMISNKDGGAHVDENIPSDYAALTRENSVGHKSKINNEWEDVKSPELATMRQIRHEVLKTFLSGYKKLPKLEGDGYIMGCS